MSGMMSAAERIQQAEKKLGVGTFETAPQGLRGLPDCNFTLKEPYPPSTTALKDLQPMTIADLRRNTHHRGKVLWLQKIERRTFVARTKLTFVVLDQRGAVDVLETPLSALGVDRDGMIQPHERVAVAIKEPFYTPNDHGAYVICVDHLSDLVSVHLPHSLAPSNFSAIAVAKGMPPAAEIKELGNTVLKHDPSKALYLYDEALLRAGQADEDVRRDIHRNRAEAHLQLGNYDAVKRDVNSALLNGGDERSKQLDAKALFRSARACYGLGQFNEAAHTVSSLLELVPGDRYGTVLLEKVRARLREEASGDYEFKSILATLSPNQPRVDAANYTKKTEVRAKGALAGRGLFATDDIEQGDLVVCEKALCAAFGTGTTCQVSKHNVRTQDAVIVDLALWRDISNKLMHNPSLLPQVTHLQGPHRGLGQTSLTLDGQPVIDTFQLHDITTTNNFECCIPRKEHSQAKLGFCAAPFEDEGISGGLWPHCSLINHSCLANCNRTFIGDLLVLRATRPIAAGEEITLYYLDPTLEDRQERFMRFWGFTCQCSLCVAELSGSPDVKLARKEAGTRVDALLDRHLSDETIEDGKAALRALNATYDKVAYKGVPRLATVLTSTYLAHAHSLRGEYNKFAQEVRELLLAIGFEDVCLYGDEITLAPSKNLCLVDAVVVTLLLRLAGVRRKQGERMAADKLEALAKKLYVVLNGLDNGFAEMKAASVV